MIHPKVLDLTAHVAHLLYIRSLLDLPELAAELEVSVNELVKELKAAKRKAA